MKIKHIVRVVLVLIYICLGLLSDFSNLNDPITTVFGCSTLILFCISIIYIPLLILVMISEIWETDIKNL